MWGNELLGSVLRFPRAFLASIVVYLLLLVKEFLKTLCSLFLGVFLMKQSAIKSKHFVPFLT